LTNLARFIYLSIKHIGNIWNTRFSKHFRKIKIRVCGYSAKAGKQVQVHTGNRVFPGSLYIYSNVSKLHHTQRRTGGV